MTIREDMEHRIQQYLELHTQFGDNVAEAGVHILADMSDEFLNKEIEEDD